MIGLVQTVLWVPMFCKIFKMNKTGWIVTSGGFLILFIVFSWAVDKTSLRKRIEGEGGRRSEPIIEILNSLRRIEERLNERR